MSQIAIIVLVAMIFLGVMAMGVGPHNGPRRAYRNRSDRRKLPETLPQLQAPIAEFALALDGVNDVLMTFTRPVAYTAITVPKIINGDDGTVLSGEVVDQSEDGLILTVHFGDDVTTFPGVFYLDQRESTIVDNAGSTAALWPQKYN